MDEQMDSGGTCHHSRRSKDIIVFWCPSSGLLSRLVPKVQVVSVLIMLDKGTAVPRAWGHSAIGLHCQNLFNFLFHFYFFSYLWDSKSRSQTRQGCRDGTCPSKCVEAAGWQLGFWATLTPEVLGWPQRSLAACGFLFLTAQGQQRRMSGCVGP